MRVALAPAHRIFGQSSRNLRKSFGLKVAKAPLAQTQVCVQGELNGLAYRLSRGIGAQQITGVNGINLLLEVSILS